MDEQLDIKSAVEDLEPQVERLKALYQQYFMGIEKLPPSVLRKNVDRTIWRLRRVRFPNTQLRFKFQQIIQRYNTYQQYWARILRDIEKGTHKRDLVRAAKRFGKSEVLTAAGRRAAQALGGMDDEPELAGSTEAERVWELPASLDDLDDAPTPAPLPATSPPSLPADEEDDIPAELMHALVNDRRGPARGGAPAAAPPVVSPAEPTPSPGAARPAPRRGALFGARLSRPRDEAPIQAAEPRMRPLPPPPQPRATEPGLPPPPRGTRPGLPPPPPTREPPPAPRRTDRGLGPSHPDPPPPPRQAAPPVAPQARADDGRSREIFDAYVRARQASGESISGLTYDKMARSLATQTARLRQKHGAHADVDFEVVTLNGKTMIRPVVK